MHFLSVCSQGYLEIFLNEVFNYLNRVDEFDETTRHKLYMQYNTHIYVYMKVNMMKYLINIREECLNSHQVTINIYMDDIENNN